MIVYFVMFALLLASTGNLVPRAVYIENITEMTPNSSKKTIVTLAVALVCYFIEKVAFV